MTLPYRWGHFRLKVAAWVAGDNMAGVVAALWLTRIRAKAAITPDGQVVLDKCKPLAEVLYAPLPGKWRFRMERVDDGS